MATVLRQATTSSHFIYLLAWWLDLDLSLDGTPQGTVRKLFEKADRAGVEIRLLLYKNPIGNKDQEATVKAVNDLRHGAAIWDDRVVFAGAHHQKVLVVNGFEGLTAFCGGIDLNYDRVRPVEGEPGTEYHDVHCRIRGPAANVLLTTFIERWVDYPSSIHGGYQEGALRGRDFPPTPSSGTLQYVGVGRTYANGTHHNLSPVSRPTYHFAPHGERTARAMILNAIGRARRFIYIEDQYFYSEEAVQALVAAFGRGLKHLTIVLTWPSYLSPGMASHRLHGLQQLRAAAGDRLRVCFLTPEAGPHTYVHSKLTVVDDEFVSIGSANYNRRSFTNDSEIVAGIVDQHSDGDIIFNLARRLRIAIWAEHLAMNSPAGYAELADGVASAVHFLDPPAGARVVSYDERGKDYWGIPDTAWDLIDPDGS